MWCQQKGYAAHYETPWARAYLGIILINRTYMVVISQLRVKNHLQGYAEQVCGSHHCGNFNYPKISNIRGTKSQILNDSRLVLQLSAPNPLKPGVKSRLKM